ncbi:hypothetical protein K438DRAFT_1977713 [Mycena galopus ATCC 62051]|nr:hypothetical protein K438DRAFT_1977713 [Mycena galopus ATCC 62051]
MSLVLNYDKWGQFPTADIVTLIAGALALMHFSCAPQSRVAALYMQICRKAHIRVRCVVLFIRARAAKTFRGRRWAICVHGPDEDSWCLGLAPRRRDLGRLLGGRGYFHCGKARKEDSQ